MLRGVLASVRGRRRSDDAFGALHPEVGRAVREVLGWRELRPLQRAAAEPLRAGESALLVSPTASGKTEAALLPLCGRLLDRDWTGTAIAVIAPTKALLDDLARRVAPLVDALGRRVAVWHGDVDPATRAALRRAPPAVLLITPESVEARLLHAPAASAGVLDEVRAVVVDELHALAADDRGWHLLGLLSRLEARSGRAVQRVGLSATVGDPAALLRWFVPDGRAARVIGDGADGRTGSIAGGERRGGSALALPVSVTIDRAEHLADAAATVARRLRRTKRLVFCDSRGRVETLAAHLRSLGVRTFVSHSSLGPEVRRTAEQGFAESDDCAMVATSTLELGVDVGDLDHVVQIDAPGSVASFLQRLGRTGRRPGTVRNALLLPLDDAALLQAAALVRLWRSGHVEPATPPPCPAHVLAQQVLALAARRGGVTDAALRRELREFLVRGGFGDMDVAELLRALRGRGWLAVRDGASVLGDAGRRVAGPGGRGLLAVFRTHALLSVRWSGREVGRVHPFLVPRDRAPVRLALAGRTWEVESVDWDAWTVAARPVRGDGAAQWLGHARPLSRALCAACRTVLTERGDDPSWTRATCAALARLRQAHRRLQAGATTITIAPREVSWWTFGGLLANEQLATWAAAATGLTARAENLRVVVRGGDGRARRAVARRMLELAAPPSFDSAGARRLAQRLKFIECVPEALVARLLEARFAAADDVAAVLAEPRVVRGGRRGED